MAMRTFYGLDNSNVSIDISSYGSNAWLAGFFDADGNLYFEYGLNPQTGVATRLKQYGRLYQANKVYYDLVDCNDQRVLMVSIGEFLSASVTYPSRKDRTGYEFRTNSKASTGLLIKYFDEHPQMTYKSTQFELFKQVYAIKIGGKLTQDKTKELASLKAKFFRSWFHDRVPDRESL